MKHKSFRRLTAALCALVMLLALVPAAQAAGSSETLTEPSEASNSVHDYRGYSASTIKSYLYVNEKGGLTRVDGGENQLLVEDYDSSFRFLSGKIIRFDGLPKWGGFFAGEQYNFIITGQDNLQESDSVEIVRILKYSKDWQYLGKSSVYGQKGSKTQIPFRSGSLRCAEAGGILYINTSHTMYKSSDGKNHQSSMMIEVRERDMTVVGTKNPAYVSHSFNQFILCDQEGNLLIANHGDGYPRAMQLVKLDNKAGKEDISPYGGVETWSYVETDPFPGSTGNNYTGAMLGGIAETSNGYLMAYAQEASEAIRDAYQVKLAYIAKKDFKSVTYGTGGEPDNRFQVRQLTDAKIDLNNYDPSDPGDQGNPFLVPTGLSGGYVLWKSDRGEISYTAYDANGQTGAVKSAPGYLSDCQPIVYNGKAVWFAGNNSPEDFMAPIFYTLDASGVTAVRAGGGASTAPSTTAPGTPSTSTAPGTQFKDVPASHWAADAIRTCAENSIVNGVGGGRFDPEGKVSYAQFMVMLARAFFADEVEKVTDTAGKPWYYPYMQAARNYDLDFKTNIRNRGGWPEVAVADDPINRYEMASVLRMVCMCFETEKTSVTAEKWQSVTGSIKDYDQIPEMDDAQIYSLAVPTCYYLGVITGMEDGRFHGEQTMTRAQACTVMVRMLDLIGDAPLDESRNSAGRHIVTFQCRDRKSGQDLRSSRYAYKEGDPYSFTPPAIEGYTPEQTVVRGTMGTRDETVVVYYTPNSSTDSTNTPASSASPVPADSTFSDAYKSGPYYKALKEVSLTGDYRVDVMAIAASQLGYMEGNNASQLAGTVQGSQDHTEYGRFLGSDGDPWCSEFASWCARQAGVPTSILQNSRAASIKDFAAPYYTWSQTVYAGGSYTPQPGDLALFAWRGSDDSASSLSHTAIISGVSRDGSSVTVYTIDGNSSGAVRRGEHQITDSSGRCSKGRLVYIVAPNYGASKVTSYVPPSASSQTSVSLKMDSSSLVLSVGQTATIHAAATGTTYTPRITYSASSPDVIAVSSDGSVTAKSTGTAMITASMTWEGQTYRDTCMVLVKAADPGANTSDPNKTPSGTGTGTGASPGGGTTTNRGVTCTELPENGRTSRYREEWGGGNYLELQITDGNTIQLSGCIDESDALFNYVVLRALGNANTSYTPFRRNTPFSVSVPVDVSRLSELYGGDTSLTTSGVVVMVCQNYKPGDSALSGSSFPSGARVSLALDGSGGAEFAVIPG